MMGPLAFIRGAMTCKMCFVQSALLEVLSFEGGAGTSPTGAELEASRGGWGVTGVSGGSAGTNCAAARDTLQFAMVSAHEASSEVSTQPSNRGSSSRAMSIALSASELLGSRAKLTD